MRPRRCSSIPRDLRVNVPGYGFDKINDAYTQGGAAPDAQDGQGAVLDHGPSVQDQPPSTSTSAGSGARSTTSVACTSTSTAATRQPARHGRTPRSTSSPATAPVRAGRARLRALPAHRLGPRARGAPAGLPAPGEGADRGQADLRPSATRGSRAWAATPQTDKGLHDYDTAPEPAQAGRVRPGTRCARCHSRPSFRPTRRTRTSATARRASTRQSRSSWPARARRGPAATGATAQAAQAPQDVDASGLQRATKLGQQQAAGASKGVRRSPSLPKNLAVGATYVAPLRPPELAARPRRQEIPRLSHRGQARPAR